MTDIAQINIVAFTVLVLSLTLIRTIKENIRNRT
jgi:hypothetical protein